MADGTRVGAVAIGRNEGDRLRRCLEELARSSLPFVYVDSGSTDGSRELAVRLGAELVELTPDRTFTAARARNAGIARLLEIAPETGSVQVLDGDCELATGWLDAGRSVLEAEPDVAVVCGRRRERFPEASLYNRLCDIEWDGETGDVRACGGDALLRLSAFQEVGGYESSLIAGEEPELCLRLRRRGWRVRRIAHEMTLHDAAMTRFGQWWRRNVRAGHACAEGALRHGRSPERYRVRELQSILLWTLYLPGGLVLLAALHPAALLGLFIYPVQAWRIRRQPRARRQPSRLAWAYAAATLASKLPALQGVASFHWHRLRERAPKLIEYK